MSAQGTLSTAEVARIKGCSVQYVARLVREGKLAAVREPGSDGRGNAWRFDPRVIFAPPAPEPERELRYAATVLRIPAVGHDPFAQVVTAINRIDRMIGAALHVGDRPQPLAIANDGEYRDVYVFQGAIARAIAMGAAALGQAPLSVRTVTLQDLTRESDDGDFAVVSFTAPTHYRGPRINETPHDYCVPSPERLLLDLAAKWRAIEWPDLPPINLGRMGADLVRYERGTFRVKGLARPSFLAELRLDFSALKPVQRRTAWTLLRFGELRGTGGHTSYGMGRIAVRAGFR